MAPAAPGGGDGDTAMAAEDSSSSGSSSSVPTPSLVPSEVLVPVRNPHDNTREVVAIGTQDLPDDVGELLELLSAEIPTPVVWIALAAAYSRQAQQSNKIQWMEGAKEGQSGLGGGGAGGDEDEEEDEEDPFDVILGHLQEGFNEKEARLAMVQSWGGVAEVAKTEQLVACTRAAHDLMRFTALGDRERDLKQLGRDVLVPAPAGTATAVGGMEKAEVALARVAERRRNAYMAAVAKMTALDRSSISRTGSQFALTWVIKGFLKLEEILSAVSSSATEAGYKMALEFFQTAQKLDPLLPPAWIGTARVHFARGDWMEALDAFRRALALSPSAGGAGGCNVRLGIGVCRARLGQPTAARAAFARVLDIDPDNVAALCAVGVCDVNRATALGDSESTATEAVHALESGIQFLSRAYKASGAKSAVACVFLAEYFFYKGDAGKARALATKTIDLATAETANVIRGHAAGILARLHHMAGEDTVAQQYYGTAQKNWPECPIVLLGSGQLQAARGQTDEARKGLEALLELRPDAADAHILLGMIHAKMIPVDADQMEELDPKKRNTAAKALPHFQAATELNPQDVDAFLLLGSACMKSADIRSQFSSASAAPADHPLRRALAAFSRARDLLLAQQTDSMDESENSTTQLAGVPPELMHNIGVLQALLGETAAALRSFRSALGLFAAPGADADQASAPTARNATTLYDMACALEQDKEDPDSGRKADEVFQAILAEFPGYIDVYLRQGLAARARGDSIEALRLFALALLISRGDDPSSAETLARSSVNDEKPELKVASLCKETKLPSDAARKLHVRNATALIGSVLLDREKYEAAQKAFEALLYFYPGKDDPFALVAMGNLYYVAASGERDRWTAAGVNAEMAARRQANEKSVQKHRERQRQHRERAMKQLKNSFTQFWNVLRRDPRNIYAANGVALVYAEQAQCEKDALREAESRPLDAKEVDARRAAYSKKLNLAKECFTRVQEAADNIPDVRLNLGITYLRDGLVEKSINVFTAASKRFFNNSHPQVLLYLARACFDREQYADSAEALTQALLCDSAKRQAGSIAHTKAAELEGGLDARLWFDLALATEQAATSTIQSTRQKTLGELEDAVATLKRARVMWATLATTDADDEEAIALVRQENEANAGSEELTWRTIQLPLPGDSSVTLPQDLRTKAVTHGSYLERVEMKVQPVLKEAEEREKEQQKQREAQQAREEARLQAEREEQERLEQLAEQRKEEQREQARKAAEKQEALRQRYKEEQDAKRRLDDDDEGDKPRKKRKPRSAGKKKAKSKSKKKRRRKSKHASSSSSSDSSSSSSSSSAPDEPEEPEEPVVEEEDLDPAEIARREREEKEQALAAIAAGRGSSAPENPKKRQLRGGGGSSGESLDDDLFGELDDVEAQPSAPKKRRLEEDSDEGDNGDDGEKEGTGGDAEMASTANGDDDEDLGDLFGDA